MFERSIEKELVSWANDPYRKPLVLRGARQVGKTTIVDRFAGKFENYLSVNLEKSEARRLFEATENVKELLPSLFLYCNVKRNEGRTLLFIDEIQNSPHTVSLLRYFYEELSEIHVIAAGSLLETMLDSHISLPVGRVQYMALQPCSFVEFLNATGEERFLDPIRNADLPDALHNMLNELFNRYSLIGGMPEAVARYAAQRDFTVLDKVYNSLLNAYKNDVEKYAKNNTQVSVIRYILEEGWSFSGETITLGEFGGSPYKARETGEAFRMLEKAMLLELVYPLTSARMPMISDQKKAPKLFWFDAGLVNYAANIRKEYVTSSDLMDTWRGKAAEQIVAQELKTLSFDVGVKRNFWIRAKRGSMAEVDLVYPFDGKIIPIEVKSGHNTRLKSLHQFMDESSHDIAIRIWTGKYSIDEVKTQNHKTFRLINLPFYMISTLPAILKKQ
ncbi:putative AAA+ superfamily ATPase [Parabacteroides sp. PF5-5]|uniref:ATP-binding protein n=1 Tax=unclassified Parabacteroides TaxID=2649774 RepID=UPI00247375ED|nr:MULTISPECIES: AAA family ATPase [unclassified Parabacteroides]MDH6304265.1 putative AAA+ superfamily ATPase [Parabacteroides sp. PH5-39]MDH6315020.1 putative AAA+ superfamily ATPase [Parabacteroides sp. PF5-13]MDH6318680.1 putative AAA+ superfamily ATPase [Parabacteroides sp. PH5-13]MDH6322410.1 putative AAA+ superfamily ATPase [Parabacteroides sp. PH5-8]MDH6326455.1 putative AAA+ superfamily ATPase [Parabacteroides sp. PH5-41]